MWLPFPCSSFLCVDPDFHVVSIVVIFLFSIFKMLLHFLVIYFVSNKKSADIRIFVPLYVPHPFSLFPYVFITGVKQFDYDV